MVEMFYVYRQVGKCSKEQKYVMEFAFGPHVTVIYILYFGCIHKVLIQEAGVSFEVFVLF